MKCYRRDAPGSICFSFLDSYLDLPMVLASVEHLRVFLLPSLFLLSSFSPPSLPLLSPFFPPSFFLVSSLAGLNPSFAPRPSLILRCCAINTVRDKGRSCAHMHEAKSGKCVCRGAIPPGATTPLRHSMPCVFPLHWLQSTTNSSNAYGTPPIHNKFTRFTPSVAFECDSMPYHASIHTLHVMFELHRRQTKKRNGEEKQATRRIQQKTHRKEKRTRPRGAIGDTECGEDGHKGRRGDIDSKRRKHRRSER
jgi:hypothetical protein